MDVPTDEAGEKESLTEDVKECKTDQLKTAMTNPKLVKKFKGFMDSNETELYSAEGLPAVWRKAWHELAHNYNLHSTSAGEGISRYVIVSKRPFQVGGNKLLLSATAQKHFREDFGIKLNLCDYNDFEYLVDLYNARHLLNITLAAIAEFPAKTVYESELAWMQYLIKVKKDIWAHIKSTTSYKKFLSDDLRPLSLHIASAQTKYNLHSNYLIPENSGKMYVSFDIKSANYASLYTFYPGIFDQALDELSTAHQVISDILPWSEFICRFINDHPAVLEYLKLSKLFRQKIFWEFNHGRQRTLWEYLIIKMIETCPFINFVQNKYHISDEIVFEMDGTVSIDQVKEFASTLDSNIFRVKIFTLHTLAVGKSWMLKKYTADLALKDTSKDTSMDIKCCDPTEHTVAWKYVNGLQIDKRDLKLKYDQAKNDWIYMDPNIKWVYFPFTALKIQ